MERTTEQSTAALLECSIYLLFQRNRICHCSEVKLQYWSFFLKLFNIQHIQQSVRHCLTILALKFWETLLHMQLMLLKGRFCFSFCDTSPDSSPSCPNSLKWQDITHCFTWISSLALWSLRLFHREHKLSGGTMQLGRQKTGKWGRSGMSFPLFLAIFTLLSYIWGGHASEDLEISESNTSDPNKYRQEVGVVRH